jgi:hypothetical protein
MSAGFNPMVLSAQYSEVPDELSSSRRAKPIPLSVRTVAVPTQSGTASSGTQILFQLNSASGFIKPASMYLKCRVSVTQATNDNAQVVAWGNACRNASSIIDRFTVSSGAVLESINNYGSSYIPTLLLHCANQPYLEGDDAMLEGRRRPILAADAATSNAAGRSAEVNGWVDVTANNAGVNTFVDVAIPLYSNLFCNEKGYPLCLLAQNTLIQLDLSTVGKAFFTTSAAVITEYTVSNAQLVYDLITPSPEYLMMLKQELASGMLYQIPFVSSLSTQFAKTAGTSTTFNWGCGLSSLKGVTYSAVLAPTTVTSEKYFISDNATGGVISNTGSNFRLFLDGQQQNSVIQDSTAVRYAQMTSVFGLLTDVNRTTGAGGVFGAAGAVTDYVKTPVTYEQNYFVGGQSCAKINECMAMTGSQVNNLTMIIETSGSNAGTYLANAWHDRIMVVDASGSASIIL